MRASRTGSPRSLDAGWRRAGATPASAPGARARPRPRTFPSAKGPIRPASAEAPATPKPCFGGQESGRPRNDS